MSRLNGWSGRVPRGTGRRLARSDDSGATLILALIFITVVAVVIAAILSFVDTSMRTTIAVRDQAARAAAADGAAQVAVNYVRKNGYAVDGTGSCLAGLPGLGNFYQSGGVSYSAAVTCDPDTEDSTSSGSGGRPISDANRPGQAILTLGRNTSDGLDVMLGGGSVMLVHGEIFSNSHITVKKNVTGSADIKAVGPCTALAGGTLRSATGTLATTPPGPKCNLGIGAAAADPDYIKPTDTPVAQTVPTCTGSGARVIPFEPGVYSDLTNLNKLTTTNSSNRCQGSTLWFKPGTYYFNLSGAWLIQTGYVVGGTPKDGAADPGLRPDMPKSCMAPIPPDPPGDWTPPPANAGVEFVMGGISRIKLSDAHMELCGSYHTDAPPIAVYGLKQSVGSAPGPVVPAEPDTSCITQPSSDPDNCAVLFSDTSPHSELYIQGTTYLPKAWASITLNNRTGQVFRFGVIARKLSVTVTGSADLSGPVIEVPDVVFAGPARTVLYLQVFVCPGTTPCSTGGTPQLKVKAGMGDPSGTPVPGRREVTVYNWSVQR
jgi:hypothetical protein